LKGSTRLMLSRRSTMRLTSISLSLAILISATGCASSIEVKYVEVQICKGLEPIYPHDDDVLTDGTVDQILALNCKILACKGIEHEACK
jgi:hypothetical protein